MPSDVLSRRRGRSGLRAASELAGAVVVTANDDRVVQLDHGDGARSRLDLTATCSLERARTGAVVVDLASGCGWFDGTDGAAFEIRRPGATVIAGAATVAVTAEPDGSTAVIVVSGSATLDPGAATATELDRQAALVTGDGKVRQVVDLEPSDLASDPWVVVNRLLDAQSPAPPTEAPAVEVDTPAHHRRRLLALIAGLAAAAALALGIASQVGSDDGVPSDRPTAGTVAPTATSVPATNPAPSTTARQTTTTAAPATPAPEFAAALSSCRRAGGAIVANGTVANRDRRDRRYRVGVAFTGPSDEVIDRTTVDLAVPAGQTRTWTASSTVAGITGCERTATRVTP